MGYESPMTVQEEVIPFLLGDDNDVIALAQTGTGKTVAFGLPILQKIDVTTYHPQALVLCPTRELCLQIADDLNDYSKYIDNLKVLPVYGGSSIESQIKTLKRGVHVVVATPGRLLDLMNRKTVDLSLVKNVIMDEETRVPDYSDGSLTENTRVGYPVDYIPNAAIPGIGGTPKTVIFLTADAYGVMPPISKLNEKQAMYYFVSGFTSKLAGTERGITEPTPTFSACFGQAFLELHPTKYGEELVKKMQKSGAKAYLVNTGWNGTGRRISIKDTRGIIDAILDGSILTAPTKTIPYFNFEVPTALPGVDPAILDPRDTYADAGEWDTKAKDLASRFVKNFSKYAANEAGKALVAAGPKAE